MYISIVRTIHSIKLKNKIYKELIEVLYKINNKHLLCGEVLWLLVDINIYIQYTYNKYGFLILVVVLASLKTNNFKNIHNSVFLVIMQIWSIYKHVDMGFFAHIYQKILNDDDQNVNDKDF